MRNKMRITAAALTAAVALGVAAPAASAATEAPARTAAVQTLTVEQARTVLPANLSQQLADAAAKSGGASTAAQTGAGQVKPHGIIDKLRKKALKAAFKRLPKSWQKKLISWAKKGKGYFTKQWNKLPKWIRKTLTLGGIISTKVAIEWLIDIIL